MHSFVFLILSVYIQFIRRGGSGVTRMITVTIDEQISKCEWVSFSYRCHALNNKLFLNIDNLQVQYQRHQTKKQRGRFFL